MAGTRPILFASDGSPSAAEAQKEAFALARALDAPLVVASIAHAALPPVGYAAYGYSDVLTGVTEVEHERLEKLLAAVASEAREAGVTCSTLVVDGLVVDEICRIAEERGARLIVVGSHGWGATRRLLSGSVSTGLVHSAPCPVLVVRGSESAHAREAA